MDVALDTVKHYSEKLRCDQVLPPKEAQAALFTLTPEPEELLTTAVWEEPGQRGGVSWTLIAAQFEGLAVVRAQASTGWNAQVRQPPEGSSLTAVWRPFDRVRAVGLESVQVTYEPLETGAIRSYETWFLEFDGEDPLVLLPTRYESDLVPAFCRWLQGAIGPRHEARLSACHESLSS